MYPAPFDYVATESLDEALAVLAERGDEAKVLAGGQSLIPLLKLRFASPEVLVDINRIAGLDTLAEDEARSGSARSCGTRRVSARSSCATAIRSWPGGGADLRSDRPQPRHGLRLGRARGPAGRLGLRAAGGGCGGRRTRPARRASALPLSGFFQGPFTTTLDPAEIVTEIRARSGAALRGPHLKLERRVGDFATVAVGVQLSFDNGTVARAGRRSRASARRTSRRSRRRRRSPARRSTTRRSAARPSSRRKRPSRRTISVQRRVQAPRRPRTERALRASAEAAGG